MRDSEARYEGIYVDHIPALEHGVIGLKFPVGSATDGIRTGVAHFVEHLVCRFWQQRLGLHIQAETTREHTSYWFHTLSADLSQPMSAVLQEGVSLVRDDVESERGIILRELQQKSTSARYLGLTELQVATFGRHGYARPVIGNSRDVAKIGLEDLELALRYYEAPSAICVAGPWGEAEVYQNLDDFRITGVPEETTSRPQHYFAGRFSSSELADRTFCAAIWVVPGYSELSDRALKLLEGLWNRRLSAAKLGSRLRVSSYRHAATLTLESTTFRALSEALTLIRTRSDEKQLMRALALESLAHMRSLEDIRTRATESRFDEQSVALPTSLKELESIEEQLMSVFEIDRACILSDERVGKRLEPRGVPRLTAPTKDRLSRQCKRGSTLAPAIRVFKDEAEDRYLTFSTSPLTARTHVLLRLDCSTLGRLVSVADLQPLLSGFAGCTCERVRYEGWCALVHLSSHSYQLAIDGVLRAIEDGSFASLTTPEVSPLRNRSSPGVEAALKSSILRFVRPETTEGTLGVRVSGASIACDESIDPEPVADSFLAGLRGYGRSPEVSLGGGMLHGAPLEGIAILSGVPDNGWAMLALHEAAFDTSGTVPSLVSIVRDSGVAYELVQSFGGAEHSRYMYWGCKGDVGEFEAFRAAFDVWLGEIINAAGKVESWFLKNWVPLNLAKQRSIHQVLRDVDRAGCYLPSLNVDGELGVGAFAQSLAKSSVCRILFEGHGKGRVNE